MTNTTSTQYNTKHKQTSRTAMILDQTMNHRQLPPKQASHRQALDPHKNTNKVQQAQPIKANNHKHATRAATYIHKEHKTSCIAAVTSEQQQQAFVVHQIGLMATAGAACHVQHSIRPTHQESCECPYGYADTSIHEALQEAGLSACTDHSRSSTAH